MLDTPDWYSIGNWASGGAFDMVKGAVDPDEPLSFEHWMNSLGVAILAYVGYRGIRNVNETKIYKTQYLIDENSYSAHNVVQYEKLKAGYASEEIIHADRIGSALIKSDPMHRAASFISKQQLVAGRVTTIRGNDGVNVILLQTKGGLNETSGVFEYILTPKGYVSHQRFIAGGKYTGFPNQ